MANVSYTEDDLDRWLENSRQLKRDFEEIEKLLAQSAAQRAQERIKAITIVAKRLGQSLDDLEAAATHPWVSAAHRSLMEGVRAGEWRNKAGTFEKAANDCKAELGKQLAAKDGEIAQLQGRVSELKVQVKDLRKENDVFRNPAGLYDGKIKPIKKY